MKRFERRAFRENEAFPFLGTGEPGGKASGLASIQETIYRHFRGNPYCDISVDIPRMTVLLTDIFSAFMEAGNLYETACSELADERIAYHFQKAELPATVVGDLLHLISTVHTPLAIRSSSLLEDALYEPLAGVYETKMIPNNQFDAESRYRKLVEAIKFVYASTYFRQAKQYFAAGKKHLEEEMMGVIIQEVVGERYGNRFYPTLSGVARSHNFYPIGNARPQDGVVNLALGLGKTIMDGGRAWSYCPECPAAPPPYSCAGDLLDLSQRDFWAVNMGPAPEYNPIRETEYLAQTSLQEAEEDGTLRYVCSTYDQASDRLQMGLGTAGPRLVDFSPILQGEVVPLNNLVKELLAISKQELGREVEIEFAMSYDPLLKRPPRFGFLQVRPMVVSTESVQVDLETLPAGRIFIQSRSVMGNGRIEGIDRVIYAKPGSFQPGRTRQIAGEMEAMNQELAKQETPYLLIGFGRWGSSDPWLGIPVAWSQISGARVIVEATLPDMHPDFSQGSHFFHNISSLGVPYFSVDGSQRSQIDWSWLEAQPVVRETEFVRQVRCQSPLQVLVNGRDATGVILK